MPAHDFSKNFPQNNNANLWSKRRGPNNSRKASIGITLTNALPYTLRT